MAYNYFSHSGAVLPNEQAVVPLSDIQYSYGFAVFKTPSGFHEKENNPEGKLRRVDGIGGNYCLPHSFSAEFAAKSAKELIAKNQAETCNLKVLLTGGPDAATATLDIICLNPFFPDRKLYKQGAHAITKKLERPFPHAKTLNMLPSYLAHRDAKAAGAYDALLINRHGNVTEGTSTNFLP